MSERARSSTSNKLLFLLLDATTGAAKTGLDVTTLKLQYKVAGVAPSTATALTTLAALTTAFTAYGAKEIDATNSPGEYRIDSPDAAFADANAPEVTITITGTAIKPCARLFDITDVNTRGGNPGPILTGGTSANQLNTISGRVGLTPGAIDFPEYTPNVLAFLFRTRLITTGTVIPSTAVDPQWNVSGVWNNQVTYTSSTAAWVAWYNGTGWTISAAVGTVGGTSWSRTGSVDGAYTAAGSATGALTVVVHGNSILSSYQPDIPFPANFGAMQISSTGFVGIDWNNIDHKTATVVFSGTTIGTVSVLTGYLAPDNTSAGIAASNSVAAFNIINDVTIGNAALLTAIHSSSSGSGTGAHAIQFRVTDGTIGVQFQTVIAFSGTDVIARGSTDNNGHVTLNLNDGTYTIVVSANGLYGGMSTSYVAPNTPADLVVSKLVLTPATTPYVTGYLIVYDINGTIVVGAAINFNLIDAGIDGRADAAGYLTVVSDSNGLVQRPFLQGAIYQAQFGAAGDWTPFTAPSNSTPFILPRLRP